MSKPAITQEYVEHLRANIAKGRKPKKTPIILSRKAFIKEMLPEISSFLAEGYDYKNIAEFLGPVTPEEVRKVVESCAKEEKKKTKTQCSSVKKSAAGSKRTVKKKPATRKSGSKR